MNAIKKAISEIKYRIPRQLLEKVFVDGSRYYRNAITSSLDEQIESLVIRPRVMVDCNLIGGTEINVPLTGLPQDKPLEYTTVIHIPKSRTNGLSINSVIDVTFFNSSAVAGYSGSGIAGYGSLAGNGNGYGGADNSALAGAAAGVMSALDKIPMTSTSRVKLIAENTVLINDGIYIPDNSVLRCVVENDANMNNLPLRAYPQFCQLVEYAVKAYIYNELIITLDAGELRYGQTLGVFKEIVTSYADSNVNYQDYLKDMMMKVLFMADSDAHLRYIKMVLGGNR